jgi:hypothetical protein
LRKVLIKGILGAIHKDLEVAEEFLQTEVKKHIPELSYVITRPGGLNNDSWTGQYQIGVKRLKSAASMISRADVADLMIDQLEQEKPNPIEYIAK